MQYVRSNDDNNYLRMQHNRSSTNPSPGPQPYRNSYPRPEPQIPTYVLSPGSAPLPQRGVYEYPEIQQRPPPIANSMSDPPVHTNKLRASPDSGANGYYYPQSVPVNARIATGYGVAPANYYPPSYSPQQMLSPPPQMGTNIPPPPPPPPPMYVRPTPQTYYSAPPPPPPPPPMPQSKERHPAYYRTGPKAPSSPQQYFSPPRFMPPRPAPAMSAPAPAQMQPHAVRAKNSFGQQTPTGKWPVKSQPSGSYHGNSYGGAQYQAHRPTSSTDSQNGAPVVAYLRNRDRKYERSKFTTHVHCLEPVSLVNKLSPTSSSPSQQPSRGNLLPLFKASEDWIAPTVGLPLENRPGYRCLLYIVDGSLLYDNGLSAEEKLLSKGTLLLSTTTKDVKTYVKNPSKTHRAHIIRLWIETDVPKTSALKQFPDYSYKIRHIADSDMQNCLLTIAQPVNYHPSFGMTARIYGPFMPTPFSEKPEPSTDSRPGAVSPLESAYYMSQSVLFTRPDYFTHDPVDFLDSSEVNNSGSKEWGVTDPELTSRVCVDPLLVDEDVFISVCTLDCDARIVYEPYDLHDEDRRALAMKRNTGEFHPRSSNAMRGVRRRLWIQTLLADFNIEATANGGRLVINGDGSSRMRPGDSAYIRRIEITDKIVIENCGRAPIEFMLVETPY
ncbi:hypothetical protein GGI14_003711 [Coemansia sp. S680]|nr:hypothetical protein GGI14_003711 [Coemansia sp. S680]